MEILEEIYWMVNAIMIDFYFMVFRLGLHDFLPVDEQAWFLKYLNRLKSASSVLISSDDSVQDVEIL